MSRGGQQETIDVPSLPATADPTQELLRRIAELAAENERLAEAVAARDAFIAVAAHELRNPMTPIAGRLDLLRKMVGTAPADKISQSFDQIEWLITKFIVRAGMLLDVSRLTSGKIRLAKQSVDLSQSIAALALSFAPIAERAKIALTLDVPTDITVVGDKLAIEQILDNLVSNAIKYGAGSPIRVSVRSDDEGGAAYVTVRDGGPGISPDSQARIFERFERAVDPNIKAGGFGLGLWIVKQLCEAMNGAIEVTSAPGKGSSFKISLPLQSGVGPQ